MNDSAQTSCIDPIDRAIVRATQSGLPLMPMPYHEIAARLGIAPEEVMARLRRMLDTGAIRRIGLVPNHYALGYRANGMSVWDVADDLVDALGPQVGVLACVSHCYLRPRVMPVWPYNLFAMVHGRTRAEVETGVRRIAELLGSASGGHEVLYSSRILKKTGVRLTDGEESAVRTQKAVT
jgi:DNA-binding Lrp family transcriptional regulator